MLKLVYHFGNQTTGLDLITEFSSLVKHEIDPAMCQIVCGSARVELYESIHAYVKEATSVQLNISLKGGVTQVKKEFLKSKTDTIKFLKANIEKGFAPSEEDDVKEQDLSPEFLVFNNKLNENFTEFLTLQNRCGNHFIQMALRQVSVEDLRARQPFRSQSCWKEKFDC